MGSQRSSSLLILGISISLFFSIAHSLDCKSQKLPDNRTYDNCTDLPTLGATLHYTYNAANSSLSVAFAAAPPADGWVAWGLNPTGGGMVGTQALMAFKNAGKVTVNLLNISSYSSLEPVKKLSFDTWDVSAVESAGEITIFAGVAVPSGNVSQVWQVGPVSGGMPGKHQFKPENLGSKAALPMAVAAGSGSSTNEKSGGAMVMGERFGLGFYSALFLVLLGFMSM